VTALYVFSPGPEWSLGDVAWLVEARRSGRLPFLVFQGTLMTDLARVADVVLPGSAWVEKDGTYTNDQGRVQASARVFTPPPDARDDREVLLQVAQATGRALPFTSAQDIRTALGEALEGNPAYADVARLTFAGPVVARNWLQSSNPSERWKWDFMFQDLAPVKFEWMPLHTAQKTIIPLHPVPDTPQDESQ
jgi:predicted molibdopterin-dependent oxidoreductase YjgC